MILNPFNFKELLTNHIKGKLKFLIEMLGLSKFIELDSPDILVCILIVVGPIQQVIILIIDKSLSIKRVFIVA